MEYPRFSVQDRLGRYSRVKSVVSFERKDSGIVFDCVSTDGGNVLLRLDVYAPWLVRVRMTPMQSFREATLIKYGFVKDDWEPVDYEFEAKPDSGEIRTEEVVVTVNSEARLAFKDQKGNVLLEEAELGMRYTDRIVFDAFHTPLGERFLGFADQGAGHTVQAKVPFDHRGVSLDVRRTGVGMRNHHAPWFISDRGYGFLLNTAAVNLWDVASTFNDTFFFEVWEQQLDYYVIHGTSIKQTIKRYTELTGKPCLPPKWAFGPRVSYWSGFPKRGSQKPIEADAEWLRKEEIPCSHLFIDSHIWKGKMDFVFHPDWFPNPEEMVDKIHSLGYRVGWWERPNIVADPSNHACHHFDGTPCRNLYTGCFCEEAIEKGYVIRNPDGSPFIDTKAFMGHSVRIDFSNPDAVEWWQSHQIELVEKYGFDYGKLDSASAGIKDEGAEDAVYFNGKTNWELSCLNVILYTKRTYEALKKALKGRRPFVATPIGDYIGGQRYTGEIQVGDRGHNPIADQIKMALNLGLSAFPFWTGRPFDAFTPGPLVVGDINEAKLRMKLLPYIYTYAHRAHETGLPLIRALCLEYQDDPKCFEVADQCLFGKEFLLAPICCDGNEREVYLPRGVWVDYWTGEAYKGPVTIRYSPPQKEVTVASVRPGPRSSSHTKPKLPTFVRGGSIIPMAPVMDYVGQKREDPLTLDIYPCGYSRFTLYEDDGDTFAYEDGESGLTEFTCETSPKGVTVTIGKTEGTYDLKRERSVLLKVNGVSGVKRVEVDGKALNALGNLSHLGKPHSRGWLQDEKKQQVFVKLTAEDISDGVHVLLVGAASTYT